MSVVSAIKRGVVLIPAFRVHILNATPVFDGFACMQKPFFDNVIPDRCPGRVLKEFIGINLTDIKLGRNRFQSDILKKVRIDVFNHTRDAGFHGVIGMPLGMGAISVVKLNQKGKQVGN